MDFLSFPNPVVRHDLASRLWRHGFLMPASALADALGASPDELAEAYERYAFFHGLDPMDKAATLRSMAAPRFCSRPDCMGLAIGQGNRWPEPRVKWTILNPAGFRGLSEKQAQDAFAWAWAAWAGVCGIQPLHVAEPARAHVVIQSAAIDGPGQTLAWSELADGTMDRKSQRFDASETWTVDSAVGTRGLDLRRTAAHEIGHVLGIPHIRNGNLLQPMYDPSIPGPQAGDIAEAVGRYGPPVSAPPPPLPEPPAGHNAPWQILISGNGNPPAGIEATGYRVSRLP